jgi:superfamily II DNA or RNA helicase
MMQLRDYQTALIEKYERAKAAGHRRIILVLPTGAGKTVVASEIIRQSVANYQNVLVFSHRREITQQTSDKLAVNAIGHGIIQAGFSPRPLESVQVASVQTLWQRGIRTDAMDLPPAKLLIIDEAHHCPASTYQQIIAAYPDATLLGLTATPCRGDGRGLGGIFETIVEGPQIAELIKLGFLVPTRCYAPVNPDLGGIAVQAGDWVASQLEARMDRPHLVGNIIENWHKFADGRRTIIFACGVGHSVHIRDEFLKSGVQCEHIDGATPKPERDASLARLASGEVKVVTNCMVLTEGLDIPAASCIVLARPTRKMGLYRQMIGRALRPAPGKTDAIIIDHSGAVIRHGFVEDPIEWTLEPDKLANKIQESRSSEHFSEQRIVECSQCSALRTAGKPCPACGFLPVAPPKSIRFTDGELGPVQNGRAEGKIYSPQERAHWHGMLCHIANERNYKA